MNIQKTYQLRQSPTSREESIVSPISADTFTSEMVNLKTKSESWQNQPHSLPASRKVVDLSITNDN